MYGGYRHRPSKHCSQGANPLTPKGYGKLADGICGKETQMKKGKMFTMRMSESDYAFIKHKADKAKMDMTGYFTASALDKQIVVVEGLDKVLSELKAIGRNLNQITTLCNMGKIKCPELAEIRQGFGAVFDSLYDLRERG
jgi:hypothetical protein